MKGFAPRIISESVIVRDANGRPGAPGAPAAAQASRKKTVAKARSVAPVAPRADGRPVGTLGFKDPNAEEPVTAPASGDSGSSAAVPVPAAKPAVPAKGTITRYASMGGGGWLLGLVVAGAIACGVVYRRRRSEHSQL